MVNTRLTVIYLITVLTVIFNLERLDVGEENIINISSFFYVLVYGSVLVILAFPKLSCAQPSFTMGLSIAVYLILKFFIFAKPSFFLGVYLYVAISELALLVISVHLALQAASSFSLFIKAIHDIILDDSGKRVQPLEETFYRVENEIIRSRRYERPLSFIIVEPRDLSINADLKNYLMRNLQSNIMSSYVQTNLSNILGKLARRHDLIFTETKNKRFILVCPETPQENSSVLADRIKAEGEESKLPVVYGVATFPNDAKTFDELLLKAESRLLENRDLWRKGAETK